MAIDEMYYEDQNLQNIIDAQKAVNKIFLTTQNSLSLAIYSLNLPDLEQYIKGQNKVFENKLKQIIKKMNNDLEVAIQNYTLQSEIISRNKWTKIGEVYADQLVTNKTLYNKLQSVISTSNVTAKQLVKDRINGKLVTKFKLSDSVWNITNNFNKEIKYYLSNGIYEGKAASEIARDVKYLLKEPDKLFRRVRNADGKLVESKAMSQYHPGQGVYKSSYKNALRLAKNEINIGYRLAEQQRRASMPFVMGQEVILSNAHKVPDICDYMKGTYPRDFVFTGWHPGCICQCISRLLTPEEFLKYQETGTISKDSYINDINDSAKNYLKTNSTSILQMKSQPYFVSDNPSVLKILKK